MARLKSAKEVKVSRTFGLSVRRHHGKQFTKDGKVFELRIPAGDITVSRLSQAIHIVFTFGVLQIN